MYENPKMVKTKQLASISKANIFLQNLSIQFWIPSYFWYFTLSLLLWGQGCNRTINFSVLENQRQGKNFEKYMWKSHFFNLNWRLTAWIPLWVYLKILPSVHRSTHGFLKFWEQSFSRTSFNGCFCTISTVRLTSENYDCIYMKHVGNIKIQIAGFCCDCMLGIHLSYKSPHSVGYSLKACLFPFPSNHPISKIMEKIFFGTVCKTPNYNDDEIFFWYDWLTKGV